MLVAVGAVACGGGTPECDPFADRIVSFSPGAGAGFGQDRLPNVALGPPVGGGTVAGGTDVISLGAGGEIVVALDGAGIVDGPGPDLIVFENAFLAGGDPSRPFAEPGAVAVSEDGVTFHEFPCDAGAFPYAGCAGVEPVLSSPDNGIAPTDPAAAGGDPFDLADVGLRRARFVRVRDVGTGIPAPPAAGFDLDAVAAVHSCL
ncbi:MAG: cell surface protein [Myxococcota bacterium]|nr:cell surface protein [Myxococcota bacterium]